MKTTRIPPSAGDKEMALITSAVAVHFRVPLPAILGECRIRRTVDARHMAMALIHDLHGYGLKRIAWPFRRDHTTVLHGLRRVAERRAADAAYEADYQAISAALTVRQAA